MSILIPIRDLEIGDRFIWYQMNGTPLYPTPYSPRGVYSENYISQVYFKNGVDILHKKDSERRVHSTPLKGTEFYRALKVIPRRV